MYGHVRACNPTLDVFHRHAGEVTADYLSNHVILLGGVAWNHVTKRFQDAIQQVPITQIEVADFPATSSKSPTEATASRSGSIQSGGRTITATGLWSKTSH